ncbi:hypothetical protein RA307_23740 [Xanthobacteraceae bacterium Astr-EGSB]|uniref:hypothetical protein n=1 Tax=Astrobacterium formosum TaxID=3069710 RepID=UPI0027B5A74B|nr:hypothetical protein [Xanthobacteraceae bacterium Astr-EGSB]
MPDSTPPSTTIADLARAGFTHVTIRCRCGSVDKPLRLIPGDHRKITLANLYGRLRCRKCLQHPEPGSLVGWRQPGNGFNSEV